MVVGALKAAVFFVVLSSGSLSAFLTRMANERLRVLEEVEKDIAVVLQCAGNIVLELSKDKHNASHLDRQLVQFQTSISRVENELGAQIRYLTQVATGQPHEGSTYSTRKDCQMSLNRAEYAKVKLGELGRTCEAMLEQQQQQI
ncbi:mediator of RNA polymerase II transcription subunit 11 [Xiphophorus couchianus]|uniref:mediator of RNA polymerase II transcription subunit 11 n=1 Tax=Xiphophorus couchianus TaxID=32473 RepID=UPI001016BB8D|nr:mediator of RNA polymerase II transcription subunit 11 [Xiphophorus couchianus]